MYKLSSIYIPLIAVLSFIPTLSQAQTKYVTDQFEITMRSGSSTSNNIISMLKSGLAVTVLEQDDVTRYSRVKIPSGKEGYVLTRFLDPLASGRDRYTQLKTKADQLEATIKQLKTELGAYKTQKQDDVLSITSLQNLLDSTQTELENLRESTRDTISIVTQNESLKVRINELDREKLSLSEENAMFKDRTAMDWFIRGASVSVIAFLLGIIVTRIRWRKRDSWGQY